MSDTPPDQKEAGGAPAGPKNPWVGWLMWAILLPVLYLLSTGPMWRLYTAGYIAEEAYHVYALPLRLLGEDFTLKLLPYVQWWMEHPARAQPALVPP